MRKNTKKKILVSVTSLILVGAVGAGIFYGVTHQKKDPIPVISFMDVGMTEYWGDNMESHGPVSSDNIQTVFLSDTQKVTEVLVKEGDTVKKGDPLMTFDTTLSALDLERKRLEVEKAKLELLDAEAELQKIKGMRPMQLPPPSEEKPENLGTELVAPYRISGKPGFDGSAADKPLICWIRNDTLIGSSMIDDILDFSLDMQVEQNFFPKSSPSAEDGVPEDNQTEPAGTEAAKAETPPTETGETAPPETDPTVPETTEAQPPRFPSRDGGKLGVVNAKHLDVRADHDLNAEVTATLGWGTSVYVFERWESEDKVPWAFVEVMGASGWVLRDGLEIQGEVYPEPTVPPETNAPETQPAETTAPAETEPTPPETQPPETTAPRPVEPKPTEPKPNPGDLGSCYVVLKTTENNMSLGERITWQGFKIYRNGSFTFFPALAIPDYTMAAELDGEGDGPSFDFGSGMTAAQIAELRSEQEKKIEELKLKVKMADAEYKIKKRELEDGNIYSDFDGKVVSLLTEEESRKNRKPMIKVSGGGGFNIEGSVGELDRETMKIGDPVTVNDWNTGSSYEGKVISIGEFPVRSRGYSGRGNPNSSYYPFTVFVDGEADLQTGSYVSIQYAASQGESGIYLNNPFLRQEKGQSYVYVLGENDRLEKRNVTTGKALWGSYTEITTGLTAEDYLAFPYGKDVKPGAKAKIGDMSDFYG